MLILASLQTGSLIPAICIVLGLLVLVGIWNWIKQEPEAQLQERCRNEIVWIVRGNAHWCRVVREVLVAAGAHEIRYLGAAHVPPLEEWGTHEFPLITIHEAECLKRPLRKRGENGQVMYTLVWRLRLLIQECPSGSIHHVTRLIRTATTDQQHEDIKSALCALIARDHRVFQDKFALDPEEIHP